MDILVRRGQTWKKRKRHADESIFIRSIWTRRVLQKNFKKYVGSIQYPWKLIRLLGGSIQYPLDQSEMTQFTYFKPK